MGSMGDLDIERLPGGIYPVITSEDISGGNRTRANDNGNAGSWPQCR